MVPSTKSNVCASQAIEMGLEDRVFVSCRLATMLCGETQNGISSVRALPQQLKRDLDLSEASDLGDYVGRRRAQYAQEKILSLGVLLTNITR